MGRFSTLAAAAAVALSAGTAGAQDAASIVGSDVGSRPLAGWTFTPTMVYAAGYDDNVMIRGKGDNVRADVVNVLGPRANLSFVGRRGQVTADYAGGFSFYRDLGSLDSFDQQFSLSARRRITKHASVFAGEAFSATPTTELLQLFGVPYIRTGSDVNSIRGGLDAQLTKRLSVTTAYNAQWVKFDQGAFGATTLYGGHSNGADASLRYQLNDLTAVTADADLQFAIVNAGRDSFDTQNASVGLERKIDDTMRVFASGGISHLAVSSFGPARTGPSWRAGLSKAFARAFLDVTYSRSYVPSFGFGGTLQNEELTAHLVRPLSRRISASGTFSWRSNEPLLPGQLPLRSVWAQGNLGYALNQWLRLEGFYIGVHQTIDQPGGILDRNQYGIQIVTAKPMRIR